MGGLAEITETQNRLSGVQQCVWYTGKDTLNNMVCYSVVREYPGLLVLAQ